jgi:hypothetical protein
MVVLNYTRSILKIFLFYLLKNCLKYESPEFTPHSNSLPQRGEKIRKDGITSVDNIAQVFYDGKSYLSGGDEGNREE